MRLHLLALVVALLTVAALPMLAQEPPGDGAPAPPDSAAVYVDDAAVADAPVAVVAEGPAIDAGALEGVPSGAETDAIVQLATAAAQGVGSGNWALAAAALLAAVVALLRRYGPAKFRGLNDRWAVILTLVASALGALVTALVGGAPLGVGTIASALLVGTSAGGGVAMGKRLLGASAVQRAEKAGAVAESKSTGSLGVKARRFGE